MKLFAFITFLLQNVSRVIPPSELSKIFFAWTDDTDLWSKKFLENLGLNAVTLSYLLFISFFLPDDRFKKAQLFGFCIFFLLLFLAHFFSVRKNMFLLFFGYVVGEFCNILHPIVIFFIIMRVVIIIMLMNFVSSILIVILCLVCLIGFLWYPNLLFWSFLE